MKRLLSTKFSTGSFNFGIFLLRVVLGVLLMSHGYSKLINFSSLSGKFMNFMNLGSTTSLCLIIFAEFFCGAFLVMGMFTRLACIPIIIGMSVVTFIASHGNIFAEGEKGAIFLAASIAILFVGPGKISIDGMIGK